MMNYLVARRAGYVLLVWASGIFRTPNLVAVGVHTLLSFCAIFVTYMRRFTHD